MELRALGDRPTTVVATLQDVRHLSDRTREVYAAIAARGADVTLYARDLPAYVAEGVRGVSLSDDDPLVDVWSVLVAGGAAPVAFAAIDCYRADSVDMEREFEAARTDNESVVEQCLALLGRPIG